MPGKMGNRITVLLLCTAVLMGVGTVAFEIDNRCYLQSEANHAEAELNAVIVAKEELIACKEIAEEKAINASIELLHATADIDEANERLEILEIEVSELRIEAQHFSDNLSVIQEEYKSSQELLVMLDIQIARLTRKIALLETELIDWD
jgi:Flp pilus assembly protein CpaB